VATGHEEVAGHAQGGALEHALPDAQQLLLESAVKKAKHDEELEIARRVQTRILPRRFDVPGWDIAATMIPATDIGGDYYDVLTTKQGAFLAIGDVSGHGLDAGLVMMMMQSAMAAIVAMRPGGSPRDMLMGLNEVLYDNIRTRMESREHVTIYVAEEDYERERELLEGLR
jgi:serine phosphatase RsbU (regulator of sigma subunit)